MTIQYPYVIQNSFGEKLIFLGLENTGQGERLLIKNEVEPGRGPAMHTHLLQDESLTVDAGKIGYQILGGPEQFAGPGESVLFKQGTPHRFWNAGEDQLKCHGWVSPANTLPYFLGKIYAAQEKAGSERPDMFDASYLLTRYSSEYDMPEIPGFVKRVIMPITVAIGKLLGKYHHFRDAPEPVRA